MGPHPNRSGIAFLACALLTGKEGSSAVPCAPSEWTTTCRPFTLPPPRPLRRQQPPPPPPHPPPPPNPPAPAADGIALYGAALDYASVLTLFIVWSVVLGVRVRRCHAPHHLGMLCPLLCSSAASSHLSLPPTPNTHINTPRTHSTLSVCLPAHPLSQAFSVVTMPVLFVLLRVLLIVLAFQVCVRGGGGSHSCAVMRKRAVGGRRPCFWRHASDAWAHPASCGFPRATPALQLRLSMARARSLQPPSPMSGWIAGGGRGATPHHHHLALSCPCPVSSYAACSL